MPNTRFDESTKAKAVRLVREHAGDYDSEWAAMCAISSRLGIVNRTAVDGRASRWRGPQHWEGRGLRQATSALAVSRLSNEVVVATDVASSRLILSQVPGAILQSYADAILGPLDASDQPEQLLPH